MSLRSVEDLLYHEMKDLLSAEKQFRDALPKLAEAASDRDLARAFEDHREETVRQITRLEKGFTLLDRAPRSKKCEGASGITKEGDAVIEEDGEPAAKDVMLAAAGRKTEHYEIASYQAAIAWARMLGQDDLVRLLEETLREEKAADSKLEELGGRLAKAAARTSD